MYDFESLENLKRLSKSLRATIEVLPETDELRALSVREILLRLGGEAWTVPCFDEFRDAELVSRVVHLHLILDACICFEEAPDFETWRRDLGHPPGALSERLFEQLQKVVPPVREIVGTEARAIDERAIEFNTDLAQALRACLDDV